MGNQVEIDYKEHTPAPVREDFSELEKNLKGEVHKPGTPGYTANRRNVWNKSARGFPSAIITPSCTEDISAVLKYAVLHDVPLCIAGGRHSQLCMVNDSIVLDMSKFNSITVDPEGKTVEVGSGVKLFQMDEECAKYNLGVVAGHNPDTGVAGLTLGGGLGYLTRKYGLSVDNLLQVEIVLASGEVVNANAQEHPDLFWALRGGGGNFGIVTKFTFRAHSLPPQVLAGAAVYLEVPIITGSLLPTPRDVFSKAVAYFKSSPEEVDGMVGLLAGGNLLVVFSHIGELESGHKELEKFNQIGTTPLNTVAPMSYHSGLQTLALGPNKTEQAPGFYFEKALLLSEVSDEFLDAVWKWRGIPLPHPGIKLNLFLQLFGPGAMNRVDKKDTAFYHRDANWWLLIFMEYFPTSATDDSAEIAAKQLASDIHKDLLRFGISSYSAVVSDAPDLVQAKLEHVFGENLPRLMEIKKKYDPTNVFKINRNLTY